MYVCVCNAVTESAIRNQVRHGLTTLAEIQSVTGCSDTCGSCREHAEEVIRCELSRRFPADGLPVVTQFPAPA